MCKRLQGTVTADDNAEQEYCYVYTNSISALFSPIHRIRHLNWVHVDAIEVLCRMQRQHFLTIRHPMAVSIRSVLLLRFPASSSCCLVFLLYHLFASSVSSYCLPRPIVFYFLLSSTSCSFLFSVRSSNETSVLFVGSAYTFQNLSLDETQADFSEHREEKILSFQDKYNLVW